MKYGIKTFSYNNCNLFIKCAVDQLSKALATIPPYTQISENVLQTGIKTTDDMLFAVEAKGLAWSVIPLPPDQIRQAHWLARRLTKILDSKIVAYQVTYPDKSVEYALYQHGEETHSFQYSRLFRSYFGFQKKSDQKDSERKPWGWVRTFFERQKIADLQIERNQIVRSLDQTDSLAEEPVKLNKQVTRIDAVYWEAS
ncbi:MAG: hypothetical protein RLO18_25840 [Gimesia chilikensis]